jgi:hypothetical protein
VLRFALYRQGQSSHVCTHWHAMAWRGSLLVLPSRAGPGYRPTDLNVQPATDRATGLLSARNGRACTRGEIR